MDAFIRLFVVRYAIFFTVVLTVILIINLIGNGLFDDLSLGIGSFVDNLRITLTNADALTKTNIVIAACGAVATAAGVFAAFKSVGSNRAWLVGTTMRLDPWRSKDGRLVDQLKAYITIENAGNVPAAWVFVECRIRANPKKMFSHPLVKTRLAKDQPGVQVLAAHATTELPIFIRKTELGDFKLKDAMEGPDIIEIWWAISYRDMAASGIRHSYGAIQFNTHQDHNGDWCVTSELRRLTATS